MKKIILLSFIFLFFIFSNQPAFANNSIILGATGSNPSDIVIDSSGNIYTANAFSNNITKITPAGVSTVFASTNINAPLSMTIDGSGNIYTANAGSNNVTKITPAGVSTILGTTGTSPYGITIDGSGNIYTANAGSNNVTKITPAGVSTILGTTGTSPYGITVDNDGNVYTANFDSNNVTKITPAGVSTILGTTGTKPRDVVVDSDGNVYTTNKDSNNVTKITPAGVSTILGTTGSNPLRIILGIDGNIYTANNAANNVSKITLSGVSTILGETGFNTHPASLVMDGSGNIYTANYNTNNVTKIFTSLSDPTVSSSVYTVNENISPQINQIPFNTSKATFLSNLTKNNSNQTFDSSNISDPVVTGNALVVTAEDGVTTRTYEIYAAEVPVVSTTSSDVEIYQIILTGNLTSSVGENSVRYIEYGTTSGIYTHFCSAGTGSSGSYTCNATYGLSPNTTYYYRAKATNSAGTAYGSELTFTTGASFIPSLNESIIANEYQGGGVAKGWSGDDTAWSYTLPFAFNFYGVDYTNIKVGSNGIICLDNTKSCTFFPGSFTNTSYGPFILPFGVDLVINEVYVTENSDNVVIRWTGIEYDTTDGVNFEVVLYSNGNIKFNYGVQTEPPLANTAVVGISNGDGINYTYSTYNGRTNLNQLNTSAWGNLVPTTTSLTPASKLTTDTQFTLTVNGTNFVQDSTVKWNGTSLTTTYVSSTQLTATVPTLNLATGGTADVTVFNPTPGGGTSGAQTFTINNPVPTLTTISPTNITINSPQFTLTATGTNFVSDSTVNWNNTALTTTYVSSTELTATVPSTNILSPGTANIAVTNSTPGGGTTDPLTFTIKSSYNSGGGSYVPQQSKTITTTQIPQTTTTITPTPTPITTIPTCTITKTLKQGSKGEEVKCLQSKLNIIPDGLFGKLTKQSVISFQKNHNLTPDGVVGKRTRGEVNKLQNIHNSI